MVPLWCVPHPSMWSVCEPVILLDPKLCPFVYNMEITCHRQRKRLTMPRCHYQCTKSAIAWPLDQFRCGDLLPWAAWQCWWFPWTAQHRDSFSFSWWPCHHSSLGLLHFCSCFPWRKDSTQFAFCVKLNKQELIRWAMIRLGIVMNWNTYLQWLLVGMWWSG